LDIRTKHTIAQDRLVIAEQRIVEAERRKSVCNLQSLAFEQKQFEKKIASLFTNFKSTFTDRPFEMRDRSTSEVIFHYVPPSSPRSETLPIHLSKLSVSLHDSNQNLLSLPKIDDCGRRLSAYSDGDTSETHFSTSDIESAEEGENLTQKYSKSKFPLTNSKRIPIKKRTLPKLVAKQNRSLPPIVAVTPPDADGWFLTHHDFV
jgi:hypothetical protein